MKNISLKQISIFLLAMVAVLFVVMFWRSCHSNKPAEPAPPVTVTTPEIPGEVVVAPTFPAAPIVDTVLLRQVAHYRQRYEYYKGRTLDMERQLAALDAALLDTALSCEQRQALLREKIAALDDGLAQAGGLVDALNADLSPKRDTGSERSAAYNFHYEINHVGEVLPGGFRYRIDVLPQVVTCPDCPKLPKHRRNALVGLVGLSWDGQRPTYGLQYQINGKRLVATYQVQWPAAGMAGVGWRW